MTVSPSEDRTKAGKKQATFATSNAGVKAKATALVRERRPGKVAAGEVVNGPGAQFGVHWGHGDVVFSQKKPARIVNGLRPEYHTSIELSLDWFPIWSKEREPRNLVSELSRQEAIGGGR